MELLTQGAPALAGGPRTTPPAEPGSTGARTRAAVLRWLAGKVGRLCILLVAVSVASFLLVEASPVDPVEAYVGAEILQIGPEQRAQIEERWGLDDPAPTRFFRWAGQAIQGNLGTSMIYNAPVADVIRTRFVSSLMLMALAWLLTGVFGFALGIVAGSRPGSRVDRGVRWWVYTLASAPTFWVALILLYVFAVSLRWAPVCCAGPIGVDPSTIGLFDRLHHLILPALMLAVVGAGSIALHTREQAVAFLHSDAAVFARAQGERAGEWCDTTCFAMRRCRRCSCSSPRCRSCSAARSWPRRCSAIRGWARRRRGGYPGRRAPASRGRLGHHGLRLRRQPPGRSRPQRGRPPGTVFPAAPGLERRQP